jgi:import inner membrane translocase subunit TIM44
MWSALLRQTGRSSALLIVRRPARFAQLQQQSPLVVEPMSTLRYFATASKPEEKQDPEEPKPEEKLNPEEPKEPEPESFQDTVRRLRGSGDGDEKSAAANDAFRKVADTWASFTEQVGVTWNELIRSGDRKSINKKIVHPHATAEGEAPYTGPVDIMVIDPSEHLTAWERMQKRLTDAPIIMDILNRSEDIYVKSGAKKVKERVDHMSEDAREAWETSQNPWVYRVSSVVETMTVETPEALAVADLRKLDPEFSLEAWRQDVVGHTLPQIMEWFLEGKINQLKPWLGEGVFMRLAAEMKAREKEGVQIDTHVLDIMNSEILACEVSEETVVARMDGMA